MSLLNIALGSAIGLASTAYVVAVANDYYYNSKIDRLTDEYMRWDIDFATYNKQKIRIECEKNRLRRLIGVDIWACQNKDHGHPVVIPSYYDNPEKL